MISSLLKTFTLMNSSCSWLSSLGPRSQKVLDEEAFDRVRGLVDRGVAERNKEGGATCLTELEEAIRALSLKRVGIIQEEIRRTQEDQANLEQFYHNSVGIFHQGLLNSMQTRKTELDSIATLFAKGGLSQSKQIDFKILREIFSRLPGALVSDGETVRDPFSKPQYGTIIACYSTFRNIIREALSEGRWLFNEEGAYSPMNFLLQRELMLLRPDKDLKVWNYINKIPVVLFALNSQIDPEELEAFKKLLSKGLDSQEGGIEFLGELKEVINKFPEEVILTFKKELEKALCWEGVALKQMESIGEKGIESLKYQKALQSILDFIEDKDVKSIDFQVFAKVCLPVSCLRKSVDLRFLQKYLAVSRFFNQTLLNSNQNQRLLELGGGLSHLMWMRELFLQIDVEDVGSCDLLYDEVFELQEKQSNEWEMTEVRTPEEGRI